MFMQRHYSTPELTPLGQFKELTQGVKQGGKAYPLYDLLPAVGADGDDGIGCTYTSNGKAGCIFS